MGEKFDLCQSWVPEGRLDLDFQVGKGVDPLVFPLPTETCAKSAFSDRKLVLLILPL